MFNQMTQCPIRRLCSMRAPTGHTIPQGHPKYSGKKGTSMTKFNGSCPLQAGWEGWQRGGYKPGLIYICEKREA